MKIEDRKARTLGISNEVFFSCLFRLFGSKRPCIALGSRLFKDDGQTVEERFAVLVVSEDFASLNSTNHYMLKQAGRIKSA